MDVALYVHVPFCGQRCAYCHFHIKVLHPRSDALAFYAQYLQALDRELETLAKQHGPRRLSSVFLGGGTPSQLGPLLLRQLLSAIRRHFELAPDCEVSLEVNPEDVGPDFLHLIKEAGYNRVSMGVQSFHDPSLKAIGRPHDSGDALMAIANAPIFPRGLSIDLILGLPFQSEATLRNDLDTIHHLWPEHVALYMLERDLPSPLDKTGRNFPIPTEDEQADYYELVHEVLTGWGYLHYELSNFCRPGYACAHNLTYWTCGDYLGAGPAAVGRVGLTLVTNHAHLKPWRAAVWAAGSGAATTEHWSPERLHQEKVIQGLRLEAGIPTDWLSECQMERINELEAENLVILADGRLQLTTRGRLLGNEVFSLFVEEV